MQINAKIFRAYDIRGRYPNEINEEVAYVVGRAFASYLKGKTFVVGRDIRLSSPQLSENIIKGIIEQGVNVVDIDLSSSPMFYYTVSKYGFDGGIMITASHNSREFNGFKMVGKNALSFSGDAEIKEIKNIIVQGNFGITDKKGIVSQQDVINDYTGEILNFLSGEKLSGLKIVIDAGNAMAGLILLKVFENLDCQIIPLFWQLDGSFPNHLPDPRKENLTDLINKVKDEKADIGIAFDGDADRMIVVDDKGEIIRSDYIIALISEMLLDNFPEMAIVCDLRVSKIVRDIIQANNGKMFLSPVGHSFIKKKMKETGAVFAGEVSGHYYLGGEYNHGDYFEAPFYVMMLLLKLLSQKQERISKLLKPFKKYANSGELNFEVEDKDRVFERVEQFYESADMSYLDGISVEFNDWWFNLRLSNTEPVIRLIIEADREKILEQKKEELMGLIKGRLID